MGSAANLHSINTSFCTATLSQGAHLHQLKCTNSPVSTLRLSLLSSTNIQRETPTTVVYTVVLVYIYPINTVRVPPCLEFQPLDPQIQPLDPQKCVRHATYAYPSQIASLKIVASLTDRQCRQPPSNCNCNYNTVVLIVYISYFQTLDQ